MSNDIDKTIEKIADDLKENTQPLPKGCATQHRINKRPSEMTPEIYENLMVGSEENSESDLGAMDSFTRRIYNSRAGRAFAFDNQQPFECRCEDCNFRFVSEDSDGLLLLADLHSRRNHHTVTFSFPNGICEVQLKKPTFLERWQRFCDSKWFAVMGLFFLLHSLYSAAMDLGFFGRISNIVLSIVWFYYLLQWVARKWRYRQERGAAG